MSSLILIESTTLLTAAPTSASRNHFTISKGEFYTLSADVLAGAEEVDIYYRANENAEWAVAGDVATEAPITLKAGAPAVELSGIGQYYVAKDATTSACGVYVNY